MAKISEGNSKLGKIPNISLMPCKDCGADVPCKKECYAMRFFRMYPPVKKAWTENSEQCQNDRSHYFADIREYLEKKNPDFFRWHVAGDIPDTGYFAGMISIAEKFPNTKFLAFTKRHDILSCFIKKSIPANLTVVASMWPGWGTAPKGYPRAWMQDGTEKRVPKDALVCPGNCGDCGACWNLKNLKKDVVFNKH
jgi:hypothetical protein